MEVQTKSKMFESARFQSFCRVVVMVSLLLTLALFICCEIVSLKSRVRQQDDAIRSLQDVTAQLLAQAAGDKRRIEMMARTLAATREKVRSPESQVYDSNHCIYILSRYMKVKYSMGLKLNVNLDIFCYFAISINNTS